MVRPLQALLAFALVVPFAPSIAGVAPHRGRTLDAAETSRLFGGGDTGLKCGIVAMCNPHNNCSRHDGEGNAGSCVELVEYIPEEGAKREACNLSTPSTDPCIEGPLDKCSTGYRCKFDDIAEVCYRSDVPDPEAEIGKAPTVCDVLETMPED